MQIEINLSATFLEWHFMHELLQKLQDASATVKHVQQAHVCKTIILNWNCIDFAG